MTRGDDGQWQVVCVSCGWPDVHENCQTLRRKQQRLWRATRWAAAIVVAGWVIVRAASQVGAGVGAGAGVGQAVADGAGLVAAHPEVWLGALTGCWLAGWSTHRARARRGESRQRGPGGDRP